MPAISVPSDDPQETIMDYGSESLADVAQHSLPPFI